MTVLFVPATGATTECVTATASTTSIPFNGMIMSNVSYKEGEPPKTKDACKRCGLGVSVTKEMSYLCHNCFRRKFVYR